MWFEAVKALKPWMLALLVSVSGCSSINEATSPDCGELFRSAQKSAGTKEPGNAHELFWSAVAVSGSRSFLSKEMTNEDFLQSVSGGSNVTAIRGGEQFTAYVTGFGPAYPATNPRWPDYGAVNYRIRTKSKGDEVTFSEIYIGYSNSARRIMYEDIRDVLGSGWIALNLFSAHPWNMPPKTHPYGHKELFRTCRTFGEEIGLLVSFEGDGSVRSLTIRGGPEARTWHVNIQKAAQAQGVVGRPSL